MDVLTALDSNALNRVIVCLPQHETLGLAALGRQWPFLAGDCCRLLTISAKTPIQAAAAAAFAGGFQRLRGLVLDCQEVWQGGERAMVARWRAMAILMERIRLNKPELTRVSIKGIDFTGDLLEAALATSVEKLRLFNAVLQLAENAPSLTRLEICDVPVAVKGAPPQAVRRLSTFLSKRESVPALIELKVSSCGDAMRCVRECISSSVGAQLQRLDLSSGALRAGGAASLAMAVPNMPRLETLLLNDNGIGPEGARALANGLDSVHSCLQELDLSGNGLGPEGIQALVAPLQQMKNLRSLRLRGSWVSSEGVPALVASLRAVADCIEELDVSQNKLDAGAMRTFLAEAPSMQKLTRLNLSENFFADDEFPASPSRPMDAPFKRLAEVAPCLADLHLRGIGFGTNHTAVTEICSSLPYSLRMLNLSHAKMHPRYAEHLVQELSMLPQLEVVILARSQMDDKCIGVICSHLASSPLKRLRVLDISGNMISPPSAKALKCRLLQMPAFKELKGVRSAIRGSKQDEN